MFSKKSIIRNINIKKSIFPVASKNKKRLKNLFDHEFSKIIQRKNYLRTTPKSFNFEERSPTKTIPKNKLTFSSAANFLKVILIQNLRNRC